MPYRKIEDAEVALLDGWDGSLGKQYSIMFEGEGPYGFPVVEPYQGEMPTKLVAYNALTRVEPDQVTGIHCFLQDNKFEAVWTYPKRAIARLSEGGDVCLGPDFSMFCDWPVAVQISNKYRNHWVMVLWQAVGLAVIPTVSWSDDLSYAWCFDGLPKRATLAVSSVGCMNAPNDRKRFNEGYEAMIKALHPERVLFYGRLPKDLPRGPEHIFNYGSSWEQHHQGGEKN